MESNEVFRGLTVDLTTVLEKRNADCSKARKIIGSLITALLIGDKGAEESRQEAINSGRQWLADYNSRVYEPNAAPQPISKQ